MQSSCGRPDGYVGAVVDLNEAGWKALDAYFAQFLVETSSASPKL